MALRGIKPKNEEKRLKLLLYGQAGIGKTLSALQFPNAYILDCEKGTSFYDNIITKNNSVVFYSYSIDEIKEEIRELITTKHNYKTLIVDPITQIYNNVQEKWNARFEKHAKSEKEREIMDFGMRYWAKVKADFKGLERLLLGLDMNVIVISHQKDVYGTGFAKIGTTFDSIKGEDYIFDYIFQLVKKGEERIAITIKERAELNKQKFPAQFDWSYENFLKFYGKEIIEKESVPIVMATKEEVLRVAKLIEAVRVDEETITKWLTKAEVNSFEDMSQEQIKKCIVYLEKKLDVVLESNIKEAKETKGGKK